MKEKELSEKEIKELSDKEKKLLSYELNFIKKIINNVLNVLLIMIILTTIIQIFKQL